MQLVKIIFKNKFSVVRNTLMALEELVDIDSENRTREIIHCLDKMQTF
jgi:hypothetical protein